LTRSGGGSPAGRARVALIRAGGGSRAGLLVDRPGFAPVGFGLDFADLTGFPSFFADAMPRTIHAAIARLGGDRRL
jgi:hypothetical protein